ncbi:MAG TPA: diacylglycerol kinase family protein [Terriglobales bacterium]|nr:diacylglycerol kinase family protein [Terriglobales bacterium]
MTETLLAIINPAAGGGRCGHRVGAVLDRLRKAGIVVETKETSSAGHATRIAREAYAHGYRKFIAVGGDGTSYEIVNGLFPESSEPRSELPRVASQENLRADEQTPTLGFLPLGTGNSFLRDFSDRNASDHGLEYAIQALLARRSRPCDVLRLTHKDGQIYYTNLLSVGFAADVATLRHRRFQALGQFGYLLSIFVCLARLNRRAFPVRFEDQKDFDARRCLFLTFNNSKFTGGTMMIAPDAVTDDGLIEYVRWGPIGRLGLIRNLSTLYNGTHTRHPLAEHHAVRRLEFQLDRPVDVMVDGEVLTVECQSIDVLPSALRVVV